AKVPPGQIDRAEDLSELCLMQDPNDPTTGQPDAKSKIVKACVEKLLQKIDKKCAGVDLALAFPGFDPNDSLQAHVDARVECEVCQAINAADGLTRACDLFDDGVANESCGGVLPGCAGEGAEPDFESTFEGIQTVIFDGYSCNNSLCHHASDFPAGGLDLTPGNAHGNLVAVPSTISTLKRVDPGDQDLSFLYAKLAAATLGAPLTEGGPMPLGGAISAAHLEAIRLWIRGGAPSDLVVEGTAELLGSCLPEPQPLTMPVPDAPGASLGAQLQQTPWPLGLQSEAEICMATYYNLAATSLVPEAAKVPCPPSFVIPSNPTGECVLYHKLVLYQDSQSHHSIITVYGGQETTAHPAWGPFTFKFQNPNNPLQGMSCDPTAVDPNTGFNPGCSGAVTTQLACLGFGPPDFSVGFGTAPNLNVSQEPLHVQEYADGVYSLIPMAGILAWNSHAFNLTNFDNTLSQYLNLHFADPNDQLYPVESIFDVSSIFVMNVAPFETEEYCKTYTMAQGTRLFRLASHTHRHGVQFRIWEPPNAPCSPGPGCVPGNPGQLIYLSTDYTDPVQLEFDPPIALDDAAVADRTYLYCSLYDNGSTPSSPEVSRNSHPVATCGAGVRECLSGPNKSVLCGGDDAFCDSSAGAGDGECDACPVVGGVTTEGDMFVLFGSFYTP
ncbi:MAG: hypothetical protein V3T24_08130, partial [Longimicrobiales bacterium]